MFETIRVEEADKDLLYDIADWIYCSGWNGDVQLREIARRITQHLSSGELDIQKRYLSPIRQSFSSFCDAYPDKKEAALALRRKISDIINT